MREDTEVSVAEPDDPNGVPNFADLSAEMLAAVFDQSLDCIKLIGPTGKLDFMNRNGLCAMEIDDLQSVAGEDWWSLWPGQSQDLIRDAVGRARHGETVRFEAFCPTAKGSPRWWDVSVSPLRDFSGELRGLISVSRDVTQRALDREMRETAVAEMRHRLQNAYALAGALVNSEARGDQRLEPFAQNVLQRLARLGAAQRLMLESGDITITSCRTLIERLLEPFGSTACKIDLASLPDFDLVEEDVRTLALVFGELCTNSNKYGAMGFGGSVRLEGEVAAGRVTLRWKESFSADRRPGPQTDRGGTGHRLVNRALASRGGEMTVEWHADGLDIVISFPARLAA